MGDRMNRSLSAAYRELGEDLNSSALIAELRAVRNIHSECIFYTSTRTSFPCVENAFSESTPVAYLNRPELYLPAIQMFGDIQKQIFQTFKTCWMYCLYLALNAVSLIPATNKSKITWK